MASSSNTICPECGESFKDLRGLNGHMRFKHRMSTEEIQEELDARREGNPGMQAEDQDTYTLIDRLSELDRKREKVDEWDESNEFLRHAPFVHIVREDQGAERCREALNRIEDRIRKLLAAEAGSEVNSVPDRDALVTELRQVFDLVDRFAKCREKREKVENRPKSTDEAVEALKKIERNILDQLPGETSTAQT